MAIGNYPDKDVHKIVLACSSTPLLLGIEVVKDDLYVLPIRNGFMH